MAHDTLDCPTNISDETISGWRDFPPTPAEAARIREHVATCPACQRREADFDLVASALLRQHEIEPDDRILDGVRQRAMRARIRARRGSAPRIWSGLGALAAVAALVLLFVYVFGSGVGRPIVAPTIASTTPLATTPSASQTPVPSLTPLPALPLSTVVDAQTAWGAHANTTFNTRLDATHVFEVGSITPDGRNLPGYRITLSANGQVAPTAPAEAGFVTIATRRFTSIGLTDSALFSYGCCIADGHYLLMGQDVTPQATCSLCDLAYWAYDMNTGQKYLIAKGTDFQLVESTFLDHGLLVMGTGEGVKVANLATHVINAVPGIPDSAQLAAVSWPYLLYRVATAVNTNAPLQARVHDLSTGRDFALPQVDGDYIADGTTVVLGDTLFFEEAQPGDPSTPGAMWPSTLYELDSFTSPGATLKAIATYEDGFTINGATARLVIISSHQNTLAWDRAEHRFVRLDGLYSLSGNYLIANTSGAAGNGSVPATVSIYDTATLPALTTG